MLTWAIAWMTVKGLSGEGIGLLLLISMAFDLFMVLGLAFIIKGDNK